MGNKIIAESTATTRCCSRAEDQKSDLSEIWFGASHF